MPWLPWRLYVLRIKGVEVKRNIYILNPSKGGGCQDQGLSFDKLGGMPLQASLQDSFLRIMTIFPDIISKSQNVFVSNR